MLLSNWEDQIVYEPSPSAMSIPSDNTPDHNLTTPANKVLESGAWTQSIIWHPNAPFRDFTQLEFNHEDDVVPEERNRKDTPFRLLMQSFIAQQRKLFDRESGCG